MSFERLTRFEKCSFHNEMERFAIQEYVDNPLLLNGHKFDFRCVSQNQFSVTHFWISNFWPDVCDFHFMKPLKDRTSDVNDNLTWWGFTCFSSRWIHFKSWFSRLVSLDSVLRNTLSFKAIFTKYVCRIEFLFQHLTPKSWKPVAWIVFIKLSKL